MSAVIESFGIDDSLCVNNVVSSIGGRNENQDRCGMMRTRHGLLVVVCDGMGGANGGATASKLAVEEIIRFVDQPTADNDLVDNYQMMLRKAILSANRCLMEVSKNNPSLAGMGTTVTAVLINENNATLAYVGDSRIYQIRNGKKYFRTFDHSMVFELVRKGILTEEQARLSAQSNVILRALGQKEDVEVDTFECAYDKGDIFFLCTDGMWGTMPEKELIKHLSAKKHPKLITESLAESINMKAELNGGGHDNLTAAMLVTKCNSKQRSNMESLIKKILYICLALLFISLLANIFLGISYKKAINKDAPEQVVSNVDTNQVQQQVATVESTVCQDTTKNNNQ